MKKSRKMIMLLAISIVLTGLLVLIWYQAPKEKYVSMTLCSLDGEEIEVVLDVSWHKYLLASTELKGTITVNGTTYQSVNTTSMAVDRGTWIERLNGKIKNEMLTPWFAALPLDDINTLHENCVFLESTATGPETMNFDMICMVVVKNGVSNVYYGPAKQPGKRGRFV